MPTPPDGALVAEPVRFPAPEGGWAPGYLARPAWRHDVPAVVVLHHREGLDAPTEEIVRRLAADGYAALAPNLHFREERLAPMEAAAEQLRHAGGVPDDRAVADVGQAADFARHLSTTTGALGLLGFCSGGRQAYLAACTLPFEAVVVCYGGRVVADRAQLSDRHPVAPIDMTPNLSAPLLGLFGKEDTNPSPADVAAIKTALTEHRKVHAVHSYEGTGHAFFAVDRPSYRPEAANDGWQRIWAFFGRHLAGA